jgi:hypothetical protein
LVALLALQPPPYDTGDILHGLVKETTGQDVSPGCGCRRKIWEMNQYGPSWAREHVDEIVMVMLEEAQTRGLIVRLDSPVGPNAAPWAAKRLVMRAIRIGERKARRK